MCTCPLDRVEVSDATLVLGNCLDRMTEIQAGSVDMVLADLPYGLTRCRWDSIIPLELLWAAYRRVLKSNGVVALTASQPFTSVLVASNLKWFRHEWIWLKNMGGNFANTVREPMKEHESVVIFSPGKWTYNKQMQQRSASGASRARYRYGNSSKDSECYNAFSRCNPTRQVLRVPSSYQRFSVERGLHPTQKPVTLCEYLIRTYTNEGETVLDNAAGSFSTAIACLNTGRRFIGIEKDEAYFGVGVERVRTHVASRDGGIGLPLFDAAE